MENYQVERVYEDEDEIDLVELLKTIIKEKKLVAIITIISVILAAGFAYYKENQPKNYGVNITFSEQTTAKINQYNSTYKNASSSFNQIVQNSFDSLLKSNNEEIKTVSAADVNELKEILNEDYQFVKVIDSKNKSYKLFAKVQHKNANKLSDKIFQIVKDDTQALNKEFNNELTKEMILTENNLKTLKKETTLLNEQVMKVVKENFKDVSKENMNSNLLVISPILYVEYKQKIDTLNSVYLTAADLINLKKETKNLFALDGEKNITEITLTDSSVNSGLSSKLIILIGAFLGIFAGMFLAIIKTPLKNIFKELKEEKNQENKK